jgi:epoxyqueuosine reductase QueG
MKRNTELTEDLEAYKEEIGLDLIGFADPAHFNRYSKFQQPSSYLSEVKTVILLGMHLYDLTLDTWSRDPKSGKEFHFLDLILENLGNKVEKFLKDKGFETLLLPYSPGLFLKEVGALAGLGPIGKNNLLLTKDYGPQIRLRALTTSAPLTVGTPINESEFCKNCEKCLQACPAEAFVDGKYHKELCLQYSLDNLKYLSRHSKIWCNKCIEVCPVGKNKKRII